MKILKSIFLFFLLFTQVVNSQQLLKSNLSSFSSINLNNDTLLITSNQILNTFNVNQTTLNGYFPLFYSPLFLNVDSEYSSDINIFPNPFSSLIFIKSDLENSDSFMINIRNIQGKLVYQTNQFQNNINLSEIESGVYFISFISNGNLMLTKKIVKY
jgi:hypothetical protein